MPLFYQQNINEGLRLAIWEITENEKFFNLAVPLQRQITHPHKKLQHLAGRFLLPFLYADFPNNEIAVADTRRPFLPKEQYHFSISHCSKFAAAIVSSNQRVGIDVELVTHRLHKIKSKFLHAEEQRFVNTLLAAQQLPVLSILWSAKEAMYKWYGEGEVDFSEMMRVLPFEIKQNGELNAAFIKGNLQQKLILHYKLFQDLTLVWVASDIV